MSVGVQVRGLGRSFGGVAAVAGVDLDIPAGTLVAVVGPSGCGKTTLLRLVAGLEEPDAGEVLFDGAPRPADRMAWPTTMVFQTESLFPDLTVAENIGFGLRERGRGRGREASEERIAVAMLRMGLTGLERRYPGELSGGQQRRVAIARALVTHPGVLLLDEPLAGLDANLAGATLHQIRTAQQRLGLTTLLVTHDQEHALLVADLVVVMRRGRLEQVGTPRDVYERPDSVFVAEFLGRSSFLDAVALAPPDGAGRVPVEVFGRVLELPAHAALTVGPATVMIRPHALRVLVREASEERGSRRAAGDAGIVQAAHYYGDRVEYVVETEAGVVVGTGSLADGVLPELTPVHLKLDAERAWVLPLP